MTYLSVGIVGTGRVAAVHLAALAGMPDVRVAAVVGRTVDAASRFAPPGAFATDDLDDFATHVQAAIVASPTPSHVPHARRLLERGVAALVELPVASTASEAVTVAALAAATGVRLAGAQTSRWLPAVATIHAALRDGRVGPVERIRLERAVAPRARSWTDDPLLHHGQHAIDTLRLWSGELTVDMARIGDGGRCVTFAGASELGARFEVSIAHDADADRQRIELSGRDWTLASDGFGWVEGSGVARSIGLDVDAVDAYHGAIAAQDRAFVAAVRGAPPVVPFEEAIAALRVVDAIRTLLA